LKRLIPAGKREPSAFIYVIQCNEMIKVGNPYQLHVIGSWRAVNAVREEEIIHCHLEQYREAWRVV
jgi:hypothetical protein